MRINIKAEVDKTQLQRLKFAIEKLISAVQLQKNDYPYRCAVDYQQSLIKAIMTQKYSGRYAPYHPRYRLWKEQYSATTGYHVLKGDFVKSIKVFKVGTGKNQGWAGGVFPGSMDTGGKSWFGKGDRGRPKSIEMYIGIMEGVYSTYVQRHPRRPLFEPVREDYAENGWKKRGLEALQRIGRSWS